ncbi:MAG: hypothetical protein A2V85_12585 [Chloroflexi bacterium RBG_16_72_14]|nr:MAG: hypothetical protein A2V85_12585 [Chloroflexi bacterium RBG_16_72_14]
MLEATAVAAFVLLSLAYAPFYFTSTRYFAQHSRAFHAFRSREDEWRLFARDQFGMLRDPQAGSKLQALLTRQEDRGLERLRQRAIVGLVVFALLALPAVLASLVVGPALARTLNWSPSPDRVFQLGGAVGVVASVALAFMLMRRHAKRSTILLLLLIGFASGAVGLLSLVVSRT